MEEFMDEYNFIELNEYKNKRDKLIKENVLNNEVILKVKEKIKKNINQKQCWVKKYFIVDKCNTEEVIVESNNERYSLRYYFNNDNVYLDNIFKYSLRNNLFSIVLIVLNLVILFCAPKNSNNGSILFFIFLLIFTIDFRFHRKKYKRKSDNFLEKIKNSLDETDFYNGRNLLYFFLTLIESCIIPYGLDMNEEGNLYLLLVMVVLSLVPFSNYLGLNLISSLLCIFVVFLSTIIDFNVWSGLVTIFSILVIIMSKDIWRVLQNTEDKKKYKNISILDVEMVEARVFKWRLYISFMTFVTYFYLYIIHKFMIADLVISNFNDELRWLGFIIWGTIKFIIIMTIYALLYRFFKSKTFDIIVNSITSYIYKGVINFPLEVQDNYDLMESELISFDPKILVKNIDDFPGECQVLISTPIKEGKNSIFIINEDGEVLYKKECNIRIQLRN